MWNVYMYKPYDSAVHRTRNDFSVDKTCRSIDEIVTFIKANFTEYHDEIHVEKYERGSK